MLLALLGFISGLASIVFLVMYVISLITKKNSKKNLKLFLITLAAAVVLIVVGAVTDTSTSNKDSAATATAEATAEATTTETAEKHLYDTVEVFDLMNGTGTDKIGEYSIIRTDSSNVTEDSLFDWYMNYVSKNEHNFDLIAYTDKEGLGCYTAGGNTVLIEKDIPLIQGKDENDLSVGSSVNTTIYGLNNEHTGLVVVSEAANLDEDKIIATVEGIIPEEYKDKNIDSILLDVYNDKNDLVFYLVNDSFTSLDTCQAVVEKTITDLSTEDFYPQIGMAEYTFQAGYDITYMIRIEDLQSADLNNLKAAMDVTEYNKN